MSYSNLIGKGAEMERLTDKNIVGKHFYPKCFEKCDGFGASSKCNNCEIMTSICEKLGKYEDLEEQGLLLRLPCKVGDTIWYVDEDDDDYPIKLEIDTISRNDNKNIWYYANDDVYGKFGFIDSDFGKTVFLTKSEAEAKLKELRGAK